MRIQNNLVRIIKEYYEQPYANKKKHKMDKFLKENE